MSAKMVRSSFRESGFFCRDVSTDTNLSQKKPYTGEAKRSLRRRLSICIQSLLRTIDQKSVETFISRLSCVCACVNLPGKRKLLSNTTPSLFSL